MRIAVGLGKENVEARLERQGVSRRDFLKFCSMVAVTMGMGTGFAEQVARALTMPRRPSVVYLHNAECTGCSEALLRTGQPSGAGHFRSRGLHLRRGRGHPHGE